MNSKVSMWEGLEAGPFLNSNRVLLLLLQLLLLLLLRLLNIIIEILCTFAISTEKTAQFENGLRAESTILFPDSAS